MSADSEGLHPIANTAKADRQADVVFVHGLAGGSHSTWRHGEPGSPGHFFWPEALGRELSPCGIWVLGHESGISHWFSAEGMALEDRAANFALKLSNGNFGQRPLIFVTHSMGGLVVKEFLTASAALGGQDWAKIARGVQGVVFLGTPHHGSNMASVAKGFSVLLRTQEHLKQMKFAGRELDQLHKRFVKWHGETKCQVESYVETQGIMRHGLLTRFLPRVVVVPRISGDPNLGPESPCHPIGADHVTLVKPNGNGHDVYAGVRRFIVKALQTVTQATAPDPALSEAKPGHISPQPPLSPYNKLPADISRIVKYAPSELIGREAETKLLTDAWDKVVRGEKPRPHVVTFVALGGEGKTSLVAKWAANLAAQDWSGCDAAFAWSFYSQGAGDQVATSSDLFFKEAITFFGNTEDKAFAASPAGAFEKAQRLARLVGERRNLLILDGLEPLQYPPTSTAFEPGRLKDDGIAKLLKDLATNSKGFSVITTRCSLPDLKAFKGSTVIEEQLKRLSREAGVRVLKAHGVTGSDRRTFALKEGDQRSEQVSEFEKLVEDIDGHALTLHIMGSFLKKAFCGDIRCRDRVTFDKASQKTDRDHAMRAMAAYAEWMEAGSDDAKRELAILRLMGLFDRPADAGCLSALLQIPAIPGLTEPLVGLSEEDWNTSLDSLESAKLITQQTDDSASRHSALGIRNSLDAHPLLREYFARQLRDQSPEAWRAAHRRVYEHLCANTPDKLQPTLEDLQPLYQAVAHGCQAGLHQEACNHVFFVRINRSGESYSIRKLGAFGSDLGAVACFFDSPWDRVSTSLSEADRAWMISNAAFNLRALARLFEAMSLMKAGLSIELGRRDWNNAARTAGNLSELELNLGNVTAAVGNAETGVKYADLSGDVFLRLALRAVHAYTLFHANRNDMAKNEFIKAEEMQRERQPASPLLYSVQGIYYCDFLLAESERSAWNGFQVLPSREQKKLAFVPSCDRVMERAEQTLRGNFGLLSRALAHLAMGRAALYKALLSGSPFAVCHSSIDDAVIGFRRAGTQQHLPGGLLTRAWLRFIERSKTGHDSAQSDIDEAWEIAERGPMRLFMADILLHRARLFFREKNYPWQNTSAKADLAAARKLIEQCGYWRRKEELEDAEAVIGK